MNISHVLIICLGSINMNSIEKILFIQKIFNIPVLKILLTDRSPKNKRLVEKFNNMKIKVNWRVINKTSCKY